jgi:hypothetical protein
MTGDEIWAKLQLEMKIADEKNNAYRNELVDGEERIPLEGFASEKESIQIAEGYSIEKLSDEDASMFYKRFIDWETSNYKSASNRHFLVYKFKAARASHGGLIVSDHILMSAVFFALCSDRLIRIDKAQSFGYREDKLVSLGVSKISASSWTYEREVIVDDKFIDRLKEYWPLYFKRYQDDPQFALVARRFYYSLIRNSWQDKLVDIMIALEAFLLPEWKDENNKGAKLAKRLSRLLKDEFNRDDVANRIKDRYKVRNSVMHGEVVREEIETFDEINILINYVRVALLKCLKHYSTLSFKEVVDVIDPPKKK